MDDSSPDDTERVGSKRAGASFAGGLFVVASGLFSLSLGLATLFYDQFLRYGPRWVFKLNEPWWGLIHVILGAAMMLIGFAAMTGARWARTTALALTTATTTLMLIWTIYYPAWTVPAMLLGVLAIGALLSADPVQRR
ncbi:hypothetical protein AU195_16725 [Mycobacterium sp. IS-1496]|uniref:DUF7144 family membrane protein n=1 Tax=Mycobacterium sp. IS-1496 TaxID=1772284 RepID=UPI0007415B80|nr:hypothetical protein [Mycobacterium sp. IS-1496]KUI37006.1 hypothetical protein AU195_16725 [Mycobacterium sp. IS-1496]